MLRYVRHEVHLVFIWYFFLKAHTHTHPYNSYKNKVLTWHDITDGHKTGVLEAGEITQQFPVDHAVPVSDGIVLRARRTAPYY